MNADEQVQRIRELVGTSVSYHQSDGLREAQWIMTQGALTTLAGIIAQRDALLSIVNAIREMITADQADHAKANAELLAAAPRLYEALHMILEALMNETSVFVASEAKTFARQVINDIEQVEGR